MWVFYNSPHNLIWGFVIVSFVHEHTHLYKLESCDIIGSVCPGKIRKEEQARRHRTGYQSLSLRFLFARKDWLKFSCDRFHLPLSRTPIFDDKKYFPRELITQYLGVCKRLCCPPFPSSSRFGIRSAKVEKRPVKHVPHFLRGSDLCIIRHAVELIEQKALQLRLVISVGQDWHLNVSSICSTSIHD